MENKIKKGNKILINSTISFMFVFAMLFILLIIEKYAPFGNNSFAWMDANIQYMDFFSYFKDVLEGKNSIFYTLSNTLGNTGIGIYGYYLSSPLNILILLFSKDNIPTFFNLLVVVKLALTSFTFSWYIQKRFKNMKPLFVYLLAISYSLMQYNIAQASNIMWIDAVYMLPLILLGVYELVKSKKMKLLSISVGLSIAFNWYTGGINCLFSIFWFLVEELLDKVQGKNDFKESFTIFIKDGIRYVVSMSLGVMLSMILFLPNVLILRGGKGSSFDWDNFRNVFRGNMLTVIKNYHIGTRSTSDALTIFCGSIPLIGCMQFFISKSHKIKIKIVLAITLLITIMFSYWQPLFIIFSLLKQPESYFYRFAYVIIFTFIFIAANYYENIKKESILKLIITSVVFGVVSICLNLAKDITENKLVYISLIYLFIITIFIMIYIKTKNKKNINQIVGICILLTSIIEMMHNTRLLMLQYQYAKVDTFNEYQVQQEKQLEDLKKYDVGNYRVSQIETRQKDDNNLTLNYNEALALNYMSINAYTSTSDNNQMKLLDKLGYKSEGKVTNIINTSIVGADSLLGVKYVLSPYDIKGLEKINEIEPVNGKYVYRNPYALDMAFVINNKDYSKIEASNSFEYQNKLYSYLVGKDITLYKEVKNISKIATSDNMVRYDIEIPNGNYALYGNLAYSAMVSEELNVNDVYTTGYACYMSPTVFYVPTNGNKAFVTVESNIELSIDLEQFYVLDLDTLKQVTEEINDKKVDIQLNQNNIKFNVKAEENTNLCTTIPYIKGMKIFKNGEEIEVEKVENALMVIPLTEGENSIEIKYHLPGFKTGICVTIFAIGIIVFYSILIKKKTE